MQTNVQAALNVSASATLHRAMINPPSAGPTIEAISNVLAFHVTALLKTFFETSPGKSDEPAGRAKVSAHAFTKTMPYVTGRYCFHPEYRATRIASAAGQTTSAACVAISTRLRLNTSLTCPASSA